MAEGVNEEAGRRGGGRRVGGDKLCHPFSLWTTMEKSLEDTERGRKGRSSDDYPTFFLTGVSCAYAESMASLEQFRSPATITIL